VEDREAEARQQSWGADADWKISKALDLQNSLGVVEGANGDPAGRGRVQQDRGFRRFQDQLTLSWTPTEAFRLTGRLEGRADTSDAKNYYDPLTFGFIEYRGEGHDLAAVIEGRVQLVEGLDFIGGVRREGSHRDITPAASGVRSRVGSAEATTVKGSFNWTLDPALRLYAGFGQGFRMPNLVEFTLNAEAEAKDGAVYPIDPERSRTVQVGATGSFGQGFQYRLEAQRTRISNLLAYVYDTTFSGAFTDHYVNSGNVQASSLEGALGWRGGSSAVFGWDLVLRSQDTRDLDHNVDGERYGQVNTAIVRHPFFSASASGFVQWSAYRADLRLDRVGPRYDLQDVPAFAVISTGKAYHELSAAFAWTATRHLELQLRGEHLLQPHQTVASWLAGTHDQEGDASLVYGYPAPERRVSLHATWRW
jgi:outer membrane receptor protein involved in Fe transport